MQKQGKQNFIKTQIQDYKNDIPVYSFIFKFIKGINIKLVLTLIKIATPIFSVFYVCQKTKEVVHSGFPLLETFLFDPFIYILGVILIFALMFVNWGIESYKWKLIISSYYNISLRESLKNVFIGVAVGLITPNRIGEVPGRLIGVPSKHYAKALFSTALGSLSQLTTTFVFGLASFPLFYFSVFGSKLINRSTHIAFFVIGLVFACIAIFMYFKNNKIGLRLLRKSNVQKYLNSQVSLPVYSKSDLWHFLILSMLRYIVFCSQFILVLIMMNVSIELKYLIVSIPVYYLLCSIVPSYALAEIGVKSAIIVYVLSFFSTQSLVFLTSGIIIWLINIATPALLGSYFLIKDKS